MTVRRHPRVGWHLPISPTFKKLRQESVGKFKASLGYIANPMPQKKGF